MITTPTQCQSRFLLPFWYDALPDVRSANSVIEALLALHNPATEAKEPIWEKAEPRELYCQEGLPWVRRLLFGNSATEGGHYLRIADRDLSRWFQRGITAVFNKEIYRLKLAHEIGIELSTAVSLPPIPIAAHRNGAHAVYSRFRPP